jgi:hypothetical protein
MCEKTDKVNIVTCTDREWQIRWDDFINHSPDASLPHMFCWQSLLPGLTITGHFIDASIRIEFWSASADMVRGSFSGKCPLLNSVLDYGGITLQTRKVEKLCSQSA